MVDVVPNVNVLPLLSVRLPVPTALLVMVVPLITGALLRIKDANAPTVVPPEYVFVPPRVKEPRPIVLTFPVPEIFPYREPAFG